jgi:hypothetical protein
VSERDAEAWHAFRRAVREADQTFQKSGDGGTNTWLREHLEPQMEREGVAIVRASAVLPGSPQESALVKAARKVVRLAAEGRCTDAAINKMRRTIKPTRRTKETGT